MEIKKRLEELKIEREKITSLNISISEKINTLNRQGMNNNEKLAKIDGAIEELERLIKGT
jgi:coenzyme F420-reducing hydrogenase delta subunit